MAERGYGAARRWAVVLALVAGLLATPSLIGALPASDADTSAADLRDAVLVSADVGFSGYAESAGGLTLPVSNQLSSVADLLSDRTVLRVWWRGPEDKPGARRHRHRRDRRAHRRRRLLDLGVRGRDHHPRRSQPARPAAPPDLLPTSLGRRLLSEAAYNSGTYTAWLTVTWGATFTVNGGAAADVPGSATTDGPPVTFGVLQARPVLIGPFN